MYRMRSVRVSIITQSLGLSQHDRPTREAQGTVYSQAWANVPYRVRNILKERSTDPEDDTMLAGYVKVLHSRTKIWIMSSSGQEAKHICPHKRSNNPLDPMLTKSSYYRCRSMFRYFHSNFGTGVHHYGQSARVVG
ncbi:hypothetical protein EAF04_009154 [Stromatinia cepivora]|nr:hypothetical protein EAF04_009154 [Stromatinia cepivora]